LFLLAIGCGGQSEQASTDGNTSWLKICGADVDCGDGLSCLCGTCTASCDSNAACSDFADAVCVESTELDSCETPRNRPLCLAECSEDDDCEALGSEFSCTGGSCRLVVQSSIDEDAGALETDASAADATAPSLPSALETKRLECQESVGTLSLSETEEELEQRILGRWYTCENDALFEQGEVGIEFLPDYTFNLLVVEERELVSGSGSNRNGTWQLGDNGTGSGGDPAILLQLDSEPNGGFTVYTPAFTDDLGRMRVEVSGNEVDLVTADGDDAG
jgi:hypothetical protein